MLPKVHSDTGTLVGLCPGLDLRPQFQGDLAQLPFVQVAAALLGIQRPLLGLQQIVKGKHRHLVGQVVPGADLLAVVAVYDDQILIDDDGRIAAVLQDVLLQRGKLLPAERGSSSASSGRMVGVRSALVYSMPVLRMALRPQPHPYRPQAWTRRFPPRGGGDRNSTSVALMRKPG